MYGTPSWSIYIHEPGGISVHFVDVSIVDTAAFARTIPFTAFADEKSAPCKYAPSKWALTALRRRSWR